MSLVSWLRRRTRWGVAAAVVLGLYALLGFLAVPWIARGRIPGLARSYLNRNATVARVAFNPFTLAATVEGFRLEDLDGGQLLALDRLRVDLQASGLFRRAWRFREILVERPVAAVRILADGRPSLADLMESEAEPAEEGEAFRLPRLIVDRVAVTAGRVEFSDASRQPEFQRVFAPLSLEVRDLITIPEESGEHALSIGMGEGAELRWTGRQTVEPLRFTGRFDITGVDLRAIWDYFGQDRPIEIAGRARVVLPYDLRRGAQGEFDLSVQDASLDVSNLAARTRDGSGDLLTLPELQVRNMKGAWPAAIVEAGGVRISGPHALVRIEEDGRLNWSAILAPPPGDGEPAGAPPPDPRGTRPLQVRVGALEIEGGSARFEDRTTEPDVALDLSGIGLSLEDLSNDLAAPVKFRAKARVQESGTIGASGSVAPDPLDAEVQLELAGIDVVPLGPYFRTPGLRLGSGALAFGGRSRISGEPLRVLLTGSGSLGGVEVTDARGERLVACERVAVEGLRVDQPPLLVRIREIGLERPFAKIFIDRQGNLNLTTLAASGEAAPPAGNAQPAKVEIGSILVRDASIDYTDESLILPFGTRIHSANGSLRDLSSFGAAAATLSLEGRVAETGHVKVGGAIRLADPAGSTEIEVDFRGLEMPALTPYAATFAGYAIERGVLDMDVRYGIRDRRFIGNHRAVASDLVLGGKVEGASDAGLPVRLAVALLKDKDGRIDLEVPVEGTIDSPEFAYRKVVWQAVRTILGNIAAAPFRALGRLFGRDEEDLDLVEFDPGRSDLLPLEQDKLARLAEEIGPRAELVLEVEGRFDPVSDAAALRRMKLDALIESRRGAASAAAAGSGASTLETILEALVVERFSPEALEAERTKFTAPPPGAFDAAGFYEALRARLLEAQSVTEADLTGLGAARSAAILAALTASGKIEASRVKALGSAPVKRRKAGSERIASEMTLTARRDDGDGMDGGD